VSLRPVMPIPLATKLSIFEARKEYASNWHPSVPALATRSGAAPRIGIYSPGVGNTLGGFASNWHPSVPTLATRSGAAPQIGIYSPGVGNTLGGFASHWHLFAQCWQHARGLCLILASIRRALAMRLGATPYVVNLSSLLHHRRCSVCYVDFSLTYFGSGTTSPTASIRRRHCLQQAFDNDIAYSKHSTTSSP
jgi:hypothetical protein